MLQGERPMARDNRTIGRFKLTGIQRAMAGVPQIEVTFDIDANGILTVSAKDLSTGKAQSITITGNERMSEEDIQRAIRDAETYAASDGLYRDSAESINEARQLSARVDAALKQHGKAVDKAEKKQIKADLAALNRVLFKCKADKMNETDIASLKSARDQLARSAEHLLSL